VSHSCADAFLSCGVGFPPDKTSSPPKPPTRID
jgi:hypothetical protein